MAAHSYGCFHKMSGFKKKRAELLVTVYKSRLSMTNMFNSSTKGSML